MKSHVTKWITILTVLVLVGCADNNAGLNFYDCDPESAPEALACQCDTGESGIQECVEGILGECVCLSQVSGIAGAQGSNEEENTEATEEDEEDTADGEEDTADGEEDTADGEEETAGGEPEGGEPEGGEPEGGEPEGGEPEGGEPEGGEPEGGEPEGGEPEGGEPEGGEPEGGEPEGGEPEGGEPEGGEPEGGEPEGGEPEGGEPEGGEPEGGEPEGGEPEGGEPEGGEPEGGEPEGGEPEGGEPEGGEPEGGEPECTGPEEWECKDATTLQQCDPESGELVEETCAPDTACEKDECKPVICVPGETTCADDTFIQTCNDLGTGYETPEECPLGDGNYAYCDAEVNECVALTVQCPVTNCMSTNEAVGPDCIPDYKPEGSPCNDGDTTTLSDICDGTGACGGTPYDCPSLTCKAAPTQDGIACNYEDLPNGEPCDDGSAATGNDFCAQGNCTGIPIICSGGPCLGEGTPNGLSCDYVFLDSGTPCTDANPETGNDTCDGAGTCSGTPIDCSQPGPCTEFFEPNGTGCTPTFYPEGTPCDDGYAFTIEDTCDTDGYCIGKEDNSCDCTPLTGTSLDSLLCAMELSCGDTVIVDKDISSPSGDNISTASKAINQLGNVNNDLKPKAGSSYTIIGTGNVDNTNNSKNLSGGSSISDPYDPGPNAFDVVELSVELTAPEYALGFSIDYVFLSVEFDEYVGSIYNDKFYMFLEAPETTGGNKEIINFTDCRNPDLYFDLAAPECPLESGYCCYIAINTALSECCWYKGCPDGTWTTDISGTGFSCANSQGQDTNQTGSSTGWLRTSWPIEGGETFTLTFHIHDTADGVLDSEVILDNFQWITETVVPPGGEGGGVEGGEGGGEGGGEVTGGTISLD